MSRNDRLVRLYQRTTGTLDAVAAGTVTGMGALLMHIVEKGTLSARVLVDIETSTITVTPSWQISHDGTTWEDVVLPNNAANVSLGTGTAGADAAITRNISAPDGVYGARYCRLALTPGVTTGAAVDTYDVSYSFARDDLV